MIQLYFRTGMLLLDRLLGPLILLGGGIFLFMFPPYTPNALFCAHPIWSESIIIQFYPLDLSSLLL